MLHTFILAMLPISELRGAIPYGVSQGLGVFEAALIAIAGNIIIIPLLLFITDPLFKYLKTIKRMRHFVERYEERAAKKIGNYRKYRFLGLVLLVGIPIPTTGVYTGVVASRVLGMHPRTALLGNVIGVFMSATIVSLITMGFLHF